MGSGIIVLNLNPILAFGYLDSMGKLFSISASPFSLALTWGRTLHLHGGGEDEAAKSP